MIEHLSYLLPLLIPIYYNLTFEYYILYTFFIISNFALKENINHKLYRIFQYECFIFLYSQYIFHSIIPSYITTALLLLDYQWTEGILSRSFLFLSTFFLNYYKNPLLFYPFIYLLVLLPSYITGNIYTFKKKDIIQYNIMQSLFFFLCYQKSLSF